MRADNFLTTPLKSIIRNGEVKLAANAGTTNNILVMEYDEDHDIVKATGTDVPVNTTSGYAKGCIFIDTDVGAGTTGRYENVGTNTSCNFDVIASSIAAGSVDTAALVDDAVTLAKMDALAQGSVIIGGAASAPTALSGKGDTKILVGNATTMTSVALSGDVTMANDGDVTIGAKAVEDTMISAAAGTVLVGTKTDIDVTLLDNSGAGSLVIGQGAGETCAAAAISGDATMATTGVITVDSLAGDVTVATDKKIQFRDTDLYIQSSTDGQLDAIADTRAQITAPTIELEAITSILLDGDVTIDGVHELTTGTGDINVNGDVIVDTDKQIFLRDGGIYLQSSADGQGDFIADNVVKVTAPTIELEASTGITLDGGLIVVTPNICQGTTGYFNVKTLKYTVAYGDFTGDADKVEQSIQLGATTIIPALGRVLDVVAHCTIKWHGSVGDEAGFGVELGSTTGAGDYAASANVDGVGDLNYTAAAGGFVLAPSASATSVYFSGTPTTHDWDEFDAGSTDVYVTYVDNSVTA